MNSSQLLLVLRSFQEEDLIQFEQFLHSPYFYDKKPVSGLFRLWQYLREGLSDKEAAYFDKQRVYKTLFPQKKVFKGKLEKLMSQLYGQVKSFLIFQQQQRQMGEKTKLLHLMAAFSDRKLGSPFNQVYRKIRKMQPEAEFNWGTNFFYEQFLVQSKITEFQSLYNNRKTDLNLPNTHFYLDLYFLVLKLEYAFQLLARDLFIIPVNSSESLELLNAIVPVLPPKYLEIPVVRLYLEAYKLLQFFYQEEGEKHHSRFNQLLEEYADEMPYEQQKALQTLNRNYSVFKYQSGDPLYLERTFRLYQEHLSLGFLYQDNQILPGTLSNIVLIGLRNKAFDWVYHFLFAHKNCIGGTTNPEIVFQYNMGQYYFCIQEYDKALDHIATTYEDQFYKVAARRLEVKILYETNSDIFESKLNAFKLYIYRLTKASAHFQNKTRNQHFIDLLKQIRHPKTYKNPKRINKLLQKAKQSKLLTDKEWIIEKLEALR